MKTSKELHEQAMNLYEESLVARFRKNEAESKKLLSNAFELEKKAALLLENQYNLEPTRSKVFTSAATMAMQAGFHTEAQKMIGYAFTGNPAPEIVEELLSLLEEMNFEKHLSTKGLKLEGDEIRFTLATGNDVMKGFAKGKERGVVKREDYDKKFEGYKNIETQNFSDIKVGDYVKFAGDGGMHNINAIEGYVLEKTKSGVLLESARGVWGTSNKVEFDKTQIKKNKKIDKIYRKQ